MYPRDGGTKFGLSTMKDIVARNFLSDKASGVVTITTRLKMRFFTLNLAVFG
jgi:hypothetical protein